MTCKETGRRGTAGRLRRLELGAWPPWWDGDGTDRDLGFRPRFGGVGAGESSPGRGYMQMADATARAQSRSERSSPMRARSTAGSFPTPPAATLASRIMGAAEEVRGEPTLFSSPVDEPSCIAAVRPDKADGGIPRAQLLNSETAASRSWPILRPFGAPRTSRSRLRRSTTTATTCVGRGESGPSRTECVWWPAPR